MSASAVSIPVRCCLPAGQAAEVLFIVIEGDVLSESGRAPRVFDAASALFGLAATSDFSAGPEGAGVLYLAKPHLFTIARECPDFVVGLAMFRAASQGEASA